MSKTLEPEELMDRDHIAQLLRLAKSSVTRLAIDGVLPVASGGGHGRQALFRPSAVVAARLAQIEARYVGRGGGLDPAAERAKKDRAQAALAEQLHKKRSGEVLAVADVLHVWSNIVVAVKSRLLRLPSALTAAVAAASTPVEIEQLLSAEIRDALTELSNWTPPAAPTPKRKARRH